MMLFLVILAGAISSGVFALITLIPDSSTSKICMLGYRAHCSFAPISTIILISISIIFGFIFRKMYGKKIFGLQALCNYPYER